MPIDFRLIDPGIMQTTIGSVQQMLMNKAQRDQMEAQTRNQNEQTNIAATQAYNQNNQAMAAQQEQQRANLAQEQNRAALTQDTMANSQVERAKQQFGLQAAQEDRAREQQLQQDISKSDGSTESLIKIYQKYGMPDKAAAIQKTDAEVRKAVLQGESSWMAAKSKERQVELSYRQAAFNEGVQGLMGIQDPAARAEESFRLAQMLDALGGDTRLQDMPADVREQVFMSQALSANKNLKTLVESGLAKEYMPGIAAAFDRQGNPWLNPETATSEIRNAMAVKALREAGRLEEADQIESQLRKKNTLTVNEVQVDSQGNPVAPLSKAANTDVQKQLIQNSQELLNLKQIQKKVNEDPNITELFTYQSQAKTWAANKLEKTGMVGEVVNNLYDWKADLNIVKRQNEIFTPIEQAYNAYRKLITGAAASNLELKQLRETYLNTDLGFTAFQARLDSLIEKIERGSELMSEYQKAGIQLSPEKRQALINDILESNTNQPMQETTIPSQQKEDPKVRAALEHFRKKGVEFERIGGDQ